MLSRAVNASWRFTEIECDIFAPLPSFRRHRRLRSPMKNALIPIRDESDKFPRYHPDSAHINSAALHLPCHAGLAEQTTLASKRHFIPQLGSEFCNCLRGCFQSMAPAPYFGRHQLMRLQTFFVIAFSFIILLVTLSRG